MAGQLLAWASVPGGGEFVTPPPAPELSPRPHDELQLNFSPWKMNSSDPKGWIPRPTDRWEVGWLQPGGAAG